MAVKIKKFTKHPPDMIYKHVTKLNPSKVVTRRDRPWK